jgi:hypothetical protein
MRGDYLNFPARLPFSPHVSVRAGAVCREAVLGMLSHTPYLLLLVCIVIFVLAAVVAMDCDRS